MTVPPMTTSTATPQPVRTDPAPGGEDAASLAEDFLEILKRRRGEPRSATGAAIVRDSVLAEALPPTPVAGIRHEPVPIDKTRPMGAESGERGQEAPVELMTGLMPQSGAPLVLSIPGAPQPHADPAAFAELMARLWRRAEEQRSREVRVHFGRDAWPATGARLVRAADGTLDIALLLGDRGVPDLDLAGLQNRMEARGITIGALAIEQG